MLKNEKQFWFWWTDAFKAWLGGKLDALASRIISAMPEEATEAEIDALFEENE